MKFLSSVRPMNDEQPLPVSNAVAQARLRGEQRRMAEALSASEERYRLLFDESPYLMWVIDAGTLAFLEVNRKAVDRYGYSRDEFLAMTLLDVQQPDEIPCTLEGVQHGELAVEPRIGRGCHRTKAGELLEVSVASRPVDFAGSRALLAVIEDVSERLRMEAQLRQAQKMEAVGQLAGGVAHDFNNLLTIILGYAGLVADRLGGQPELRRQVEEIANAGGRGAAPPAARLQPAAAAAAADRGAQRGGSGRRDHAAPADRRARRAGDSLGGHCRACAGRPGPDRAGGRQPGGQRARCDAGRRRPGHRNRRRGARCP